jgi:ornithine cyclodeaminase/alanine dehydrogenase-like protein (mu-crystallin family)
VTAPGAAGAPPYLDADAVARLLGPADAVAALGDALRAGLDPEADVARTRIPADAGELLVMPSLLNEVVGVKLATIAPHNPDRGLPRIQGVYVLFDAGTLTPLALVDGIALTSLRTAAVSALAVSRLARQDARRLVVFGSGPQAWSHVQALRAVRPLDHVDVVARDRGRLQEFVERCRAAGLAAQPASGSAVESADLICCATTAREPLFDGSMVRHGATVVAVGSHEPEARELEEGLMGRSLIVVEARSAALREAGDVIQAIAAGTCEPESLRTIDELVNGTIEPDERPRVFKSTGMAWEDAVVAAELADRAAARG